MDFADVGFAGIDLGRTDSAGKKEKPARSRADLIRAFRLTASIR